MHPPSWSEQTYYHYAGKGANRDQSTDHADTLSCDRPGCRLPGLAVNFFVLSSLHVLVSFGLFGVWLFMVWKNHQGEAVALPIIGPLAERHAGSQGSTIGSIGKAA